MPLNGMSPEELEERLVLLFTEMQRVRSALDAIDPARAKRARSIDKQQEIFKTAFPRLSNPETSK